MPRNKLQLPELGPIAPGIARLARTILTLIEQGVEDGHTINWIARSEPMQNAIANLRRELGDGAAIDADKLVLSLVTMLATFSPSIDATEPEEPRLGSVGKRPRRSRPSRH